MAANDLDDNLIAQLRSYSAKWGSNALLVQGAGGNTSYKSGSLMMVKASGMRLADAQERELFVIVRLSDLQPIEAGALRPSIETSLHSLMPHTFVCHLHMVDVIAIAVVAEAERVLEEKLFGLKWAWVPYCQPGPELTRGVERVIGAGQAPDIVVVGNHGIVIGGDTLEAIDVAIQDLQNRLDVVLRGRINLESIDDTGRKLGLEPVRDHDAHLTADHTNLRFAAAGSLYPDHVVFLGRGVNVADVDKPVSGSESILRIVPGIGAFLPPGAPREAHEMAGCLGAVVARIDAGAEPVVLTHEQEDALLKWDAETYRKQLAEKARSTGTEAYR